MATTNAFPTCANDREVVLPYEHMFRLTSESIAQVGIVDIAIMQSEAFSSKANGSIIDCE